jgi:hypothetical protein
VNSPEAAPRKNKRTFKTGRTCTDDQNVAVGVSCLTETLGMPTASILLSGCCILAASNVSSDRNPCGTLIVTDAFANIIEAAFLDL